MKKPIHIIYCVALLIAVTAALSFAGDDEKNKKLQIITPYLGMSDYSGGEISKRVFDSLLKQGITANDTAGEAYKVIEFTFSYSERNIYEDADGKLVIMSDYLSEYCAGDTLSVPFQNFVFKDDRTKAGDTAYVDKIKVRLPGGAKIGTKSMRFVITK